MHPAPSQPSSRLPLIVVLLSVATLIAGVSAYLTLSKPAAPARATVLPAPAPLPDFALVDQDGRGFTRASLKGHWSLLFFGFTHCPDICPATLQQLAFARREMAEDTGTLPNIVFVSVDPERDTSEAVGAYAAAFGDGVIGVTGSLDQIDTLARALGIYHARTPTENGAYQVEHSSAVLLIDDRAQFRAVFSSPHDVETFASDTMLLMERL